MKKIMMACVLGALLFLVTGIPVQARGLYVRDRVSIPLKRSPSENAQVVGMVNAGDYLDVKEEGGEWAKVTSPDGGQEGWIPMRLLTGETPRTLMVDQVNEKFKAVLEQNKALAKENQELKYQVGTLSGDVGRSKDDYERLKGASTTYLDLKQDYDKLVFEDRDRIKKLDELSREAGRLRTSERVKFTLVGGGFIILGLILGGMVQSLRGKPKKSGYKI